MVLNFKIISCLLLLVIVGLSVMLYTQQKQKRLHFILVDKDKLTLTIINNEGDIVNKVPIAVGTGYGNKGKKGDMKTPEGIFKIQEIVDANDWEYDFLEDTLGAVKGAYGPWFLRLDVPGQKGIGIHGTHDSSTIGKRVSHGCIRMKNEDISFLKRVVSIGSPVIITAGLKDYQADQPTSISTLKLKSK